MSLKDGEVIYEYVTDDTSSFLGMGGTGIVYKGKNHYFIKLTSKQINDGSNKGKRIEGDKIDDVAFKVAYIKSAISHENYIYEKIGGHGRKIGLQLNKE